MKISKRKKLLATITSFILVLCLTAFVSCSQGGNGGFVNPGDNLGGGGTAEKPDAIVSSETENLISAAGAVDFGALKEDVSLDGAVALSDKTVEITETLRSVHALVRFLIARLRFQSAILDAWKAGKPGDVRQFAETEIPELVGLLDVFSSEIRAEWLRTARPFGLEIIQRRNAGVRERFFELLRRLRETDEIPELDAQLAALETGVRTPLRNTFSGTVIA